VSDEKIPECHHDELAAFYAAHAADLFGRACIRTRGDRALADDLVQDAFEAAAKAWRTVRCLTEAQRCCWLRTTMDHIAVTGFRRNAAFRRLLTRLEVRYRPPDADTHSEALSAIAEERLWACIQGLPERQHEVALMRWQQDMKISEIASTLGIAEKTAHAHLHQVRKKLRSTLRPYYPFGRDDAGGAPS
jgi:RNA polymerase sigma-70 factor (ECF subfamily)